MKRYALMLSPLVAFAAGCGDGPTEAPLALQPDFGVVGGPSVAVAGSGHIPSGADDKRVFSFTARQQANGSVSGQFTLLITAPVLGSLNPSITRVEAEVVCVAVSGNRAWVGGVVKSASNPAWIGLETGWAVEDNGEGAGAQDFISLMNVPAPGLAQPVCDAQSRVPSIAIENGNVQVSGAGDSGGDFFPFEFYGIPTCGESVDVTGYFHPNFHFTADRSGGFHSQGHINAQGIGVGQSSGDVYNFIDVINFDENFRPPSATFSSNESFLLVGQGAAPNLRVHSVFHVTVTPNGVVNVTADNFTYDCG